MLKAESESNVMTEVQEIVQTLTDNNNIDIDQVSFSIYSLFDSAGKKTFRSRCTECKYESKDVDNLKIIAEQEVNIDALNQI